MTDNTVTHADRQCLTEILEIVAKGGEVEHMRETALQLMASHRTTGAANTPEREALAILQTYARIWWARKMPATFITAITVKGDGRVDVSWRDQDESGKYTLPVDFIGEVTAALSQEPEAQREGEEREETTFEEVVRRIREGTFYEDYDWASGPALRALDRAALSQPEAGEA